MFRTKKDVDRHVQDIFRKLPDENERTLRCFKIAELYYNVGDYESARRYLSRYVETRKEAKALKLMGQILESLGQKEAALIQYKLAFELDGRQEDLILKVCELMAAPDIEIDVNRAKHWSERADELFPRHKIVFQLKEKMLSLEKSAHNNEDLEKLILAELVARPSDVQLRVKLLNYYIEKGKLDEAYKHATDVEESNPHRDSTHWYQVLCELFSKCKSHKESNWSYWIYYISALERYAALSLKEQGCMVRKTSEAMQAVYNFDQLLFEAKAQSFSNYPSLTEGIFAHMWGQLQFHMACLLLQNTKREHSSWSETGRLCTPLLLAALHVKPIDLSVSWATHVDSSLKNLLQLWYKEGSYRCSQAGHVLHDYARGNPKKLTTSIEKFCSGSWRERVYQRIFVSKIHQKIRTSYFANNNAMNPPFRLASHNELKRFDEVAALVWPYSLHHQVWPALKIRNSTGLNSNNSRFDGPQPNLSTPIFPDLQFSVYNLNQASPVTLSRLDVDSFLNVAVLCASAVMEEQRNNLLDPDRLPTLPADLTSPLCSEEQEKWWSAAYKSYNKEVADDVGENRQILQRGLESIRCIGNHGLHPVILVHLARIFDHRAKALKEKNYESSNIPALEARSELYWSAAVPLLERLQNNQNIRSSHSKLFDYIGRDMNNMELTHAVEEGKLVLAQKFVRDKLYDQAIAALQTLKCPEASFEQGKIYKLLADETMNNSSKESVTSEIRHLYFSILSKARNSFYLTLDRLRSPDTDPKHPLNAELCIHITSVENELKRIDPDIMCNDRHRNECDDISEESYSSAHSEEHPIVTNSLPMMNNTQTPMRSIRRSIRHSTSTPRQHHDFLDTPRNRNEARPSPERLDAQIRQLVHSIDSLKEFMMTRIDEQNKTVISKLDELIKVTRHKETQKPPARPPAQTQNIEDDLYAAYGEEDYRDFNSYSHTSLPGAGTNRPSAIPQNLFAPPRQPYSPLMYPPAAALQGYYQGGPLPFPDPAAAVAAAAAAVQPMTGLYPNPYQMSMYRHGFDQPLGAMQQMTQDVLQQGLFSQRPGPQLPDSPYPPVQQTSALSMHMSDLTKNDPKFGFLGSGDGGILESSSMNKDNVMNTTPSSVRKMPPVNVVITTSDTLPSSTSSPAQPTLSVTIPVQHRLGMPLTSTTSLQDPNTPHSYQISMPSQATIPTTVILPPLAVTLTNTSPLIKSQENHNTSVISTSSIHSNSDTVEVEHDPIPDFAPIIPLPDEVPVTTGEEDEEVLFCARAKLFRFAEKEWKERGVGNVKLLKNKEGKIRLLMRREQVHKICANHMLKKDMQLTAMPNNEKAYIWVAHDYADEEIKVEKLCIRFKTVEEAANFKENFDKAKDSLPDETAKTTDVNSVTSANKVVNEQSRTDSTQNKSGGKIGGFSFTSSPIIQKALTQDPTPKKPEEPTAKPSPFASFSFGKPSDSANKMPTTPVFSFGPPTSTTTTSKPPASENAGSTMRRPNLPASSNAAPTPKADKPLSELFKSAPGSWECKDCYTRNDQSNQYCVACEAPSDPSLPPKPKPGGLGSLSGSTSTFTFGIPQGQTNQTAPSNGSGFRLNAQSNTSEKTTSSPMNIFGANKTSGFNFGIQAPSTPPKSGGSGSCTFGSPGKGFDFQFQNKSPAVKSPERLDVSDDDVVEESEDVYFAPVIPLPDKIDVKTGEEDEDVLYSHRAKLYKYDSSTKEWKERGLGDIKLLRHVETKKLRLVMRRDQVLKLCLNHAISSSIEITPKDDKTWMWSAGDYSEGEIEYSQFACRFKTPEVANQFKKALDDACKSESNSVPPTSVRQIRKTAEKESSPDVEVVYEIKVTPEEKAAAQKLMLPENFYAYKYKADCSGCIGCRDSDDAIVKTNVSSKEEISKTNSSASVFSFGKPTTTSTSQISSTTSLTFGAPPSNIFGSAKPADNNSAKAAGFSVGNLTIIKSESQDSALENLKMCSPSNTTQASAVFGNASATSKNIFGGFGANNSNSPAANSLFSSPTTSSNATSKSSSSIFGTASTTTGSIFGGTTSTSSSSQNASSIFGSVSSTGSMFGGTSNMFGGQTSTTPSFGSIAAQTNTQAPNLFGFGNTTAAKSTNSSTPTASSTSIFGGNANSTTSPSGGIFGSKPAGLSGGNMFSGKPATPTDNDKAPKSTDVTFLPTENSLTFSALAAQAEPNQKPAFEKDPNFTFDGAGASVFGLKSAPKGMSQKPSDTAPKATKEKAKDDEEEGDGEVENGDDHDPYFEPIIPLPDAIEVRTGEEDEEKVFCERAKLYRYDQNTKEWKERGTGEMKVLHHTQHGTFRLLLRREQVHKVVCNLLVTADLDLRELNSSDRAWMWAGMNYAEADHPELEQLAVRFKNPELAQNFKQAVDNAQLTLATRQGQDPTQGYGGHQNEDEDDYEDDYADGDDYGEDDEEDDDQMQLFEKCATLYVQAEGNQEWEQLAMGKLKVLYDSEIFGARIVAENDAKYVVSDTVISMDTSMQCEDKECTWAAIDYAVEPPVKRTLKAVFASEQISHEMYQTFQEGQECATKADIRE